MKKIVVSSTSPRHALIDPVLLRESDQRRLVFQPELVDNPRDKTHCVRGTFYFQRKRKAGGWENHVELPLTKLRAEEWIRLELHSSELTKLFIALQQAYEIYSKGGIPIGDREFVVADQGLAAILTANAEELDSLLGRDPATTAEVLGRFLRWASEAPDLSTLANLLQSLEPDGLNQLNAAAGLATLKEAQSIWRENWSNPDEAFWQAKLSEHSWTLSQIFLRPVVVIAESAYVGGKTIQNTRGNLVDFLGQNEVTGNAALVEIKTPVTPLLGSLYRSDIFNCSRELSGAVLQVANYKHQLSRSIREVADELPNLQASEPLSVVVIGNASQQLKGKVERKSFELFRHHLREIEIVTFDELFAKIGRLVEVLEGGEVA